MEETENGHRSGHRGRGACGARSAGGDACALAGRLRAARSAWDQATRDGHTDTTYGHQLIDDTDQREVSGALRDVVTAVDQGYPVPILVGGAYPAHYVTVVGHHNSELLIFEPTHGVTTRVPAEDFINGNLRRATYFDHVQAVIVPQR